MKRETPLSSQQLAFLVFLLILGSALVFVSGRAAGQNAWLAELLGMFPGLYILWAILKLQTWFPDKRITQISTQVLGRALGTVLNLVFFWGIFILALSFVYDISILLKVIYPAIPRLILYPIIVLPCIYVLYKGLTAMGRMGELFFFIGVFFIALAIITAIPLMDISKLKPVGSEWKPLLAGFLYAADWPFDGIVILALFLPLVGNLKQEKRKVFRWYLISAATLTFLDLQTISILGPYLTKISQFPIFEVFRLVGFGEFKRLELGFLLMWFLTGVTVIIIYLQGLLFIFQDVFSLNDYKPLILPLGLSMIVFTAYTFPSDISYQLLVFKYLSVYTFPVNLLYPSILLITAALRKPGAQSKANKPSGESASPDNS